MSSHPPHAPAATRLWANKVNKKSGSGQRGAWMIVPHNSGRRLATRPVTRLLTTTLRPHDLIRSLRHFQIRHAANLPTKEEGGGGGQRHQKGGPWSAEEDAALLRLRREGKTCREIADLMPGRSVDALSTRYYKALRPQVERGISARARWSAEETALIRRLRRAGRGWDEIARLLPGRSVKAVEVRHGASSGSDGAASTGALWTGSEDRLLLRNRKRLRLPWAEVGRHLPARPMQSMKSRFERIDPVAAKVRVTPRGHMGTGDVEKLVRLVESGLTWPEIGRMMGDAWSTKTLRLQYRTATRLPEGRRNRGQWTEEEDKRLLELMVEDKRLRSAEEKIGRTVQACRGRLLRIRQLSSSSKGVKVKDQNAKRPAGDKPNRENQ